MNENEENPIEEQEEVDAETAAFNSMLNAAQKKLGINPDQQTEEAEESKPDRETVKSAKKVLGTGGKLSQQQIEALLNDDGSDDPEEAPAQPQEEQPEEEPFSPDIAEPADTEDPDYDDTAEIASILSAGIQKSTEEPAEEPAPEAEPAEEPKPKKNILGPIITIAAVLVALALGFCVAMLMFSDIIKTNNELFAIRAANALNSTLPVNSELYICKSYVKNGSAGDECMLYYASAYGSEISTGMCRVTVTHDKPNTVNIYYTVDENGAEYLAMKGSSDPEIRLQASFLKNYSDTVYAADKAIQIASPQWEKIDCTRINKNINSEQDSSASAKTENSSEAQSDTENKEINQ